MRSTKQPLATARADAPWLLCAGLSVGAFGLSAAVGELGRWMDGWADGWADGWMSG